MLKKMKFTWLFSGLVLLNTKEKRIMLCLGVVITISGLIETMAFGSVIPFIAFILEPEKIEANKYYQYVFSYLSEPSRDIVTYYWSAFSLFLLIFAIIKS